MIVFVKFQKNLLRHPAPVPPVVTLRMIVPSLSHHHCPSKPLSFRKQFCSAYGNKIIVIELNTQCADKFIESITIHRTSILTEKLPTKR